jgi:hypothetical protein
VKSPLLSAPVSPDAATPPSGGSAAASPLADISLDHVNEGAVKPPLGGPETASDATPSQKRGCLVEGPGTNLGWGPPVVCSLGQEQWARRGIPGEGAHCVQFGVSPRGGKPQVPRPSRRGNSAA